ncbi:hypothetical protein EP7_005240 [Isosphaeraceae bacterium EP7]
MRLRFPGMSVFVAAAARQAGLADLASSMRGVETLSSLSNLCAQAAEASAAEALTILDRATRHRDVLRITLWAAELMLEHARSGLHDVSEAGEGPPPAGTDAESGHVPEISDYIKPRPARSRTRTRKPGNDDRS